jgi:hypothetical protein
VVQRSLPAVVTSSFKIHRCLCVLRRRVDTVAVAAASGHVEPVNRTTDKPAKRGNARRWGGIRSRTASAMQPR